MNYDLKFIPTALKEWEKLDRSIKEIFKKKLRERLQDPRVPSAKLSGFPNIYKIKLRSSGYRLVYEVNDNEIFILVIAVGKRSNEDVYKKMVERMIKSSKDQ